MCLFLFALGSTGRAQAPPLLHAAAGRAVAEGRLDVVGHLRLVERRLAANPADVALRVQRIGALYLFAVDVEEAIGVGLAAVDSLRAAANDPTLDVRLLGYEGAFTVLRAKHGFWPHHRLRNVQRGLEHLDRAVKLEPRDPVLRYLRLMSGFYLPSFFGRKDEVHADIAALADLLPTSREEFPRALFGVVVRFVLENGEIQAERREVLEQSLDVR